jgi:hypothetical protein
MSAQNVPRRPPPSPPRPIEAIMAIVRKRGYPPRVIRFEPEFPLANLKTR